MNALLVAVLPRFALVAGLFDTVDWPKIVVGSLGIALGVFVARKQIDRWNQRG